MRLADVQDLLDEVYERGRPTAPESTATAGQDLEPHLKILHTVAETIGRCLDAGDVLRTAVDALTHVTGHEIASLHLISEDGTTLHLRGERGLAPALREVNLALPVGQGLIGGVAATGEPVIVHDMGASSGVLTAAKAAVQRAGIRGFVCVPVRSRGRVLGALSLGRRTDERFTARELALLEAIAGQIGIALDNARLYSELQRQLDELKRAQTQLIQAEKLSAVGQLAAGMAHEVNHPLNNVVGHAEALLLKLPTLSEAEVRQRLTLVVEGAMRASRIVESILLFSRQSAPERRAASLADQVRRVLFLKGYQLQRDGIRVVTDFLPCPPVPMNEGQIKQVLVQLIQNAHEAMVDRPGDKILTLRVGGRGDVAYVEVLDTGAGIPPEILPHVFDPFFTTRASGERSGLGLSVAYGIVAAHDGVLRVENRREGGAAFIVELPGAPASVATP